MKSLWCCCVTTLWDHCDITVTSWKYFFHYLFIWLSDITEQSQWCHKVRSLWWCCVVTLWDHTVGSLWHHGHIIFHYFNHMFPWYHRTIIVMSQGEFTVVLLWDHTVGSHCGITVTPWTYYFALFYSYVSVISQNFYSDATGWDHCDAAVWPCCGITVTSWKYYFALFIYIFQWYHRSSIVMSQGEVTVMLLCGHSVGSHCEITVRSLWHHGHIFFALFIHMFQWYHRTIIVMSHGDVIVMLRCGHAVGSLWHHGHINLHYWFICFSDITEQS